MCSQAAAIELVCCCDLLPPPPPPPFSLHLHALSPPPLQPVLGRPASTSNRGSMIMLKVDASSATGVPSSPRPGSPRLVPKQD